MDERDQLERAIVAQEGLRGSLPDEIIDATLTALREKLDALEPQAPSEQQRKQVSVLFADISGFTAMSEAMDAEDITELINALWARLDAVICQRRGRIDKHMGDAIMALWGAQQAREDDPEQAIRAALEMQNALADFRTAHNLQLDMRIGINTGPALLGEVGSTQEFTAMGDTVNTASRLEGSAPPGGVLISHNTYHHVRGVFNLQALEPISVKGKAEPLPVYLALSARPRAFRLGRRGVEGIETRMVGRSVEMEQLQAAMRSVMRGEGLRMLTVTGEAGVGKSRLLFEFENWLDLQIDTVLYFKGRAYPDAQGQPYGLLRDLFTFHFQIHEDDLLETVHAKIESGLARYLGLSEESRMRAHFTGQLLSFDFSASPFLEEARTDARQLHDRARLYLVEYFRAASRAVPAAVFLEDLHWADDSSLNLIAHLGRALPGERLLWVGLARPALFERYPDWGKRRPNHTHMELEPLGAADTRRLVGEIMQKAAKVPSALVKLVAEAAAGNPFFVEELIKMMIEDGVILVEPASVPGETRWRVAGERLAGLHVPPTLTSVLQARLDMLPRDERSALQQASVIGRVFWEGAVEHLDQCSTEKGEGKPLPARLDTLQSREMVFQRSDSAFRETREFIFKHALLRDVSYESVLKRLRCIYHRLAAEWLIERSAGRPDEYLGLIAEHLEHATQLEQARDYLRRAGQAAAARHANQEAVQYFTRALALLPETDTEGRFQLLLAHEAVLDQLGQRQAQARDLEALETLAEMRGLPEWQAEVALRRADFYILADANYAAALATSEAALSYAQAAGDLTHQAEAYLQLGKALRDQLDLNGAQEHLLQGVALAQSAGRHDLQATGLRILAGAAFQRADLTAALAYNEQSLELSRQARDLRAEAIVLANLCAYTCARGDYAAAQAYGEQSLVVCRKIGDYPIEGYIHTFLGSLRVNLGDYAGARVFLDHGLAILREVCDRLTELQAICLMGHIAYFEGDHTTALAHFEHSLALFRQINLEPNAGYIRTYIGIALAGLGDLEAATGWLQQDIALSRKSGLEMLTMEALAELACVRLAQGQPALALNTIEEVLAYLEAGGNFDVTMRHLGNYLACYKVLRANRDRRAGPLLQAAHAHLQALTANISDDTDRRSFLENIPWHRKIIELAQSAP